MNKDKNQTASAGSGFINAAEADCPAWLLDKARATGRRNLLVVRASSALVMQAAFDAYQAGVATPIFVGEADLIHKEADQLGWDIADFELISAQGELDSAQKAAIRLKNGLLDKESRIDAVMKGQLHTDIFMSALLNKEIGLRVGNRLVHVFAIFPQQENGLPILVSDAAVNISPDDKTQQQSMIEMCRLSKLLGNERPKLAILSATETPIEQMPSSLSADQYANWARSEIEDIDVSGPLSFDLALSQKSALLKGHSDNPVAGQADCLLVPDIVSGNILYKALVYLGGGCAAGMVVGGSVPVLLTSRADSPQARLASIALATLTALSSTAE